MASILMIGAGALINALAFSGTNYLFSHIDRNQAAKERQRRNRGIEQMQKARMIWSKQRTEKLDFYNKFLQEQRNSSQKIDDIVDASQQYYLATGEKQTLTQEPKLTDFYHPTDNQKDGEIMFIIGSLSIIGYIVYKYV